MLNDFGSLNSTNVYSTFLVLNGVCTKSVNNQTHFRGHTVYEYTKSGIKIWVVERREKIDHAVNLAVKEMF